MPLSSPNNNANSYLQNIFSVTGLFEGCLKRIISGVWNFGTYMYIFSIRVIVSNRRPLVHQQIQRGVAENTLADAVAARAAVKFVCGAAGWKHQLQPRLLVTCRRLRTSRWNKRKETKKHIISRKRHTVCTNYRHTMYVKLAQTVAQTRT